VWQLLTRTAAIVVAAGVIVIGATAIGYSPLGSELPGAFLPVTQQQHQGAPAPQSRTTPSNAGQATGGALGTGSPAAGRSSSGSGLFTGRNAPSLQDGLQQDLPKVVIFAGLTAVSAPALKLLCGRSQRRAGPRHPSPRTGAAAA
jgi:hypothetical protein